ncbi:hypothetical protein EDB19DRAFT_989589 [Suillus lakei]|nr:hypothetical protein EDB19DRAFT_272979 [Suillus lakei]KAG1737332.1 hypothetical protein EDB19DRAFT_989589 [Suillus lakei]
MNAIDSSSYLRTSVVCPGDLTRSVRSDRGAYSEPVISVKIAARQAIDPGILPRLDPEHVAFHNKYVTHIVPPHALPWNPAIRNGDTVPGSAEVLSVGSVQDYELSRCTRLHAGRHSSP